MTRTSRALALLAVLGLLSAGPAAASFHFAVIDEVATSVGGDPAQQFVEIQMLFSGQGLVGDTVLGAFDENGQYLGDVLVLGKDLMNSGAGVRWIMTTQAFQDAFPMFATDFTFPAGMLPVENGMICWGAPPGLVAPSADTWDHTDPSNYIDCVAYGRFCGTNSPSGAPVGFTPAEHSLQRTGTDKFTNSEFGCSETLTPRSNVGTEPIIAGATCAPVPAFTCPMVATTTTTTMPTGTTLPTVSGGGPLRTDCFGAWRVSGASGRKPKVRCKDGDAGCDHDTDPGCTLAAQLCFADAADPIYKGKCKLKPVTRFKLGGRARDDADRANSDAILHELADVGGTAAGRSVTFATPIDTATCTPAFALKVPLRTKRGKARAGKKTFRSATKAGKTDADTLTVTCVP
jgi:hypothetical protein